jgi:hypothetical protein
MKRWILVALVAAAAPGCKKGPSEDQCKKLLEHLTDLEYKKGGAAATNDQMKQDLAKQKAAVLAGKNAEEFMKTCTSTMSKGRVECALEKTEIDGDNGVAKCDEGK